MNLVSTGCAGGDNIRSSERWHGAGVSWQSPFMKGYTKIVSEDIRQV